MAEVQKTNNMPNFKKNTSPAMKRSGFKMKSSPAKNLGNFFGSIFSSKAIKGRQDAQRESNTGEYKGMTDFEKRRAEKKEMRKTGESKFQADVRKKREKKAEAKKAEAKKAEVKSYSSKSQPSVDEQIKAADKRFGEGVQINEPKTTKATIPWDKVPKVGTQARNDWYKKFNLKLDETTPLTKKSPYKKGIGSYAKKAKGSRGYKMKRK